MKSQVQKLQMSDSVKKAVSEFNNLINHTESLGLKVDLFARNPLSLSENVEPLRVEIKEIITY